MAEALEIVWATCFQESAEKIFDVSAETETLETILERNENGV